MHIIKNASIQLKQKLVIMLTTGAALLLACAILATYEIISFREDLLQNLSIHAQIIGNNTSAALDFNDPKSAEDALSALKAEPDVIGGVLYDKDGQVFAVYSRKDDTINFKVPGFQRQGHSFANGKLSIFQPIVFKGATTGTIYLQSDLNKLYSRLEKYAVIMAGVLCVALLAGFALSARLQRVISEPILHLVQTAYAVARDRNYSLRAVKRSEDELGALTDGFNEMLCQIQERDAALQSARNNLEKRVEERTHELQLAINERRDADEALRESQALYHSLVENIPAGIFRKNREGAFVFVNSWFCRLKGLSAEQILGKTPEALLSRELTGLEGTEMIRRTNLATQGGNHHESIIRNGRPVEVEEMHPTPRGLMRYLHVVKSPVFSSDGNILGSQGMLFDVTERKKAEEALRKSESQFRIVWDNSVDGMRLTNREGVILMANAAFCRMVEMTEDKIIGQKLSVVHSADTAEQTLNSHVNLFDSNADDSSSEQDVTLWNDRKVWFDVSNSFLEQDGHAPLLLSICRDITSRKQAEADMQKMHRQLVDTSRQAGMAEVATSVLHNVGNVLNSVNVSSSLIFEKVRKSRVGNFCKAANMLQTHRNNLLTFLSDDPKGKCLPGYFSDLAPLLTEEQEEILHELTLLISNIEHIKEIVAMQQNYAKVSGATEALNVVDLVEDAIRMNSGALHRHQVQLIRDFQFQPTVVVDKHKVLQILVNLIRNAKYALDDGRPSEKRLTLRIATNGNDGVKVSVIDNGVGIPSENLTRIFAHGFTTRKEGHGFGLHSGALAAKELGGSLVVQSDGAGKGATFALEFPCQPKKENDGE